MDERKDYSTVENKTDKEMLGRIWESSQGIQIPDALSPEQVKKRITDRHSQKRKFFKAAVAAACLCVCFGGGMLAWKNADAPADGSRFVDGSYESAGQSEQQNGSGKSNGMIDSIADDAADDAADIQNDADEAAEAPLKKIGIYTLASGYEDVYDVIEKASRQVKYRDMIQKEAQAGAQGGIKDISSVMENAKMEDSDAVFAQDDAIAADSSMDESVNDFSVTNLQVEGVDESDIVKTDGRYIYVVKNDRIQVIHVQNQIPEIYGEIVPGLNEDTDRIREMYVADNVLTLIIQAEETLMQQEGDKAQTLRNSPDSNIGREDSDETYNSKEEESGDTLSGTGEEEYMAVCDVVSLNVSSVTKVLTYDITDPKKAVLLHTTEQDGWYQTSRKIGSLLYLFTNKSLYVADDMLREEAVNKETVNKETAGGFLPCVDGQAVRADCIYLPKEGNEGFLMSSIDLADNNKVLDTKLIVNNSPQVYVTSQSVYLYETDYTNEMQKTRIARFELDHGMIRAKAAATVKGCIEDTFAIHEAGNYLQVLTSVVDVEPWENRVYVLDMNLEKVGKLTGLAEGERIYSARFFGTVGYFVTYRNTDPLFTVDFSNPSKPEIIGELKVTGFSEYLHFWDKDHLLGIGYETDPEDGRTIGIKMSMFDISDPTKVTEEAKTVLKDVDSCDAMYDYKCILVSLQKNVIAFTTQEYDNGFKEDYRVYSYEDGKFVSRLVHSLSEKNIYDSNSWRSVYVGDVLYLVNEKKTIAFDMKDEWKEIGKVKY